MTEQHSVAHSAVHLLLLLVSLLEYRKICNHHDGAGYPEGYARGKYGVYSVDLKLAQLWMLVPVDAVLFRGVPTVEDRHERDDGRRQPASEQHKCYHFLRHVNGIFKRLHDRVIPIYRDAHQMKYRTGAEIYIQGVPNITHEVAEEPPAGYLDAGVEGHREHRHKHVRQRQGDHEVVRYDP